MSDATDNETPASMPWEYFVSYSHPTGHGNCNVGCDNAINSLERIRRIEDTISERNGFKAVILNYIVLRSPASPSTGDHGT